MMMYWEAIKLQAEEIYKTHGRAGVIRGDNDMAAYQAAREWAKYCSWNVSASARQHVIAAHGINFGTNTPQGKNLAYAAICRDLEKAYEAVKLEMSFMTFIIYIYDQVGGRRRVAQSDLDPFIEEDNDVLLNYTSRAGAEDVVRAIQDSYKKSGFSIPKMEIFGQTEYLKEIALK